MNALPSLAWIPTTDAEIMIGIFGVFVIVALLITAFLHWLNSGPVKPDPWETEQVCTPDDETVLCYRCLVPNPEEADFCENCGAPIGEYTNYLPFPYLFSIGYGLRAGTSGEFKRTPLTVVGFVLLSIAEYSLFFPVYLFRFFQRRGHERMRA